MEKARQETQSLGKIAFGLRWILLLEHSNVPMEPEPSSVTFP